MPIRYAGTDPLRSSLTLDDDWVGGERSYVAVMISRAGVVTEVRRRFIQFARPRQPVVAY